MSKQATKTNGYERVAEMIIAALDQGTAPWRRPWIAMGYEAKSLSTKKAYRGINQMLLTMTAGAVGYQSPWWGTYKQITEHGGQIRKGEKGTYVIYFTMLEKETEDGTNKKVPLLRGFTVFNSAQADWAEGTEPEWAPLVKRDEIEAIEDAEKIADAYMANGGPSLSHGGDRAFYRPSGDSVTMPNRDQFHGSEEYYSTLFHEFGHSTGAASRLDRKTLVDAGSFGDENYSREELVAEFAAAFVCGHLGILPTTMGNTAAYIAGWKKSITNDPKAVVWAAGQAQKAADLILGIQPEVEPAEEAKEVVMA
jgi:antirestriction protein ArdC